MSKKRIYEYDSKCEREAVVITVILIFVTVWVTETIIAFLILKGD